MCSSYHDRLVSRPNCLVKIGPGEAALQSRSARYVQLLIPFHHDSLVSWSSDSNCVNLSTQQCPKETLCGLPPIGPSSLLNPLHNVKHLSRTDMSSRDGKVMSLRLRMLLRDTLRMTGGMGRTATDHMETDHMEIDHMETGHMETDHTETDHMETDHMGTGRMGTMTDPMTRGTDLTEEVGDTMIVGTRMVDIKIMNKDHQQHLMNVRKHTTKISRHFPHPVLLNRSRRQKGKNSEGGKKRLCGTVSGETIQVLKTNGPTRKPKQKRIGQLPRPVPCKCQHPAESHQSICLA